ncbi:hypothetical protein ACNVD4_05030, partial [Rhizobium sp. BR5]
SRARPHWMENSLKTLGMRDGSGLKKSCCGAEPLSSCGRLAHSMTADFPVHFVRLSLRNAGNRQFDGAYMPAHTTF